MTNIEFNNAWNCNNIVNIVIVESVTCIDLQPE